MDKRKSSATLAANDGKMVALTIDRLGAQGDGVAEDVLDDGPVFVPFTLPGERVCAVVVGESAGGARGRLVDVLEPSQNRVAPVCRHFTFCGGCALQHVAGETYASWKRSLVVDAFAQRGIKADVAPLVLTGAGSRRRAVMSALATSGGIVLGFHGAREERVVDVEECPVMVAQVVAALSGIRGILGVLPRWEGEARVTVVAADNGLDVAVSGAVGNGGLDAASSARVAAEATRLANLTRLSFEGTPVYIRAVPQLAMGAAHVTPPAGSFLQASASAERAMAEAVVDGVPKKAKRAVDLFCGVGAFTFPLAARVAVLAVDSDRQALEALEMAARAAQGLKPVSTRHRDLFREPLSRKELEPYDVAVLDPPRAGAKAQAEMLAKSKVPIVVAVSCNPATLARDARILIDGGYSLGSVTPIDQFTWSAHVEAVAVFRRGMR
ncbi:MAG: class I SAM-dependent RNA methyltransferase [Hyphomicrobiaceae bacterium]